MRRIVFETIHLEKFKSFKQATSIPLSSQAGLNFLGGSNLVQPQLGSNGAGKSTVWDGLCFGLYGVGVRGQRASDLVTWGEQKPYARIDLSIDNESHKIERHGSPNRLLLNGATASQDEIDRLLGLNRDRFVQSVLFGQSVPLFLDLSAAARSELLDAVLELGQWVAASEAAGRLAASLAQEIGGCERDHSFEAGKLAAMASTEIEREAKEWDSSHRGIMEALLSHVEQTEHNLELKHAKLQGVKAELRDLTDDGAIAEIEAEIERTQNILREVVEVTDQLDFYENHGDCPTCKQMLTDGFRSAKLTDLEDRLHGLLGTKTKDEHSREWRMLQELRTELSRRRETLSAAVISIGTEVALGEETIRGLVRDVELRAEEENPHRAQLDRVHRDQAETQARIAILETRKQRLWGEQTKVDFWRTGFRKLRLWQVGRVLQRMQVETANVASQLGLADWQIRYVTETETKTGNPRLGINVLVSTQGVESRWENYSGGEAQRIRLAVSLGIAAMIQSMAGVNYSIEIFDEASQYLSSEGVEDFLTVLQGRADLTQKSIIISDHTLLSFAGFNEIWTVTKSSAGSTVERSRTI